MGSPIFHIRLVTDGQKRSGSRCEHYLGKSRRKSQKEPLVRATRDVHVAEEIPSTGSLLGSRPSQNSF